MHDPDGRLRGHVFHICRDVRIGAGTVDYRDMLLDIWVGAGGEVVILDEDEVRECAGKGLISREDVAWIEGQRREVLARLEEIVREIGG
jgi:predicted RNA-binding protein associated with RNAse of E/G family